jgi:DNA-binding response OmpR family regulator
MRILLVEDEVGMIQFVRQGLEEAGHVLDVAQDGEAGLDHLSMFDYDAVVLDVMMPRLDGLGLLKQMRSEGDKTPVLLLTALDAIDDRVRGLDAGD